MTYNIEYWKLIKKINEKKMSADEAVEEIHALQYKHASKTEKTSDSIHRNGGKLFKIGGLLLALGSALYGAGYASDNQYEDIRTYFLTGLSYYALGAAGYSFRRKEWDNAILKKKNYSRKRVHSK